MLRARTNVGIEYAINKTEKIKKKICVWLINYNKKHSSN